MTTMNPLQKKYHRLIRATGVFDDAFYTSHSPDVAQAGMDPLEHYIVAGESEGRAPSPFFEPGWYRQQASKVAADHCLLAHYLTVGDADSLQPMVGFDPAHVRTQVPGRKEPTLVAFLGARSFGRYLNPNRFFDYGWYLQSNPDVAAAGIDAYYHFVYVGADEGRTPSADFSWYYLRERFNLSGANSEVFRQLMLRWRLLDLDTADGEPSVAILQDTVRANHRPSVLHEPHAPPPPIGTHRPCDVYAFYLTQYHRIPENDSWWGEGFTEWHNVVRGLPRFPGHYQPRTPSTLGFYDLSEERIMRAQVALARQAGLAGFAFYYYNFGSQRLLERPLEHFLAEKSLDAGYFLIWANETWSRRWDGSEAEILLEQTYPDTLADELASDLVRHFDDSRYRKIDGRPLFVIYRAGALPDPEPWIARLREAFARHGAAPLIYMAQTFEDLDPGPFGLDGALEFPPHKHSRTMSLSTPDRVFVSNPALRVWNYDDFVAAAAAEPPSSFPLIRTCFPSWDNDSRRQGASSIVHGSTPEKFGTWLRMLVEAAEADSQQPNIACINAWNEWGEGAYLEPDRHFGYAYLNTVQRVLHPVPDSRYGRLLLVGHDAFPAGAQRLLLNMGRTLKQRFGKEVAFLLLRSDSGYDGLLAEYRAVAETIIAENDLAAVAEQLAERGFAHAIVNSTASAAALPALAGAGIEQILLVHELPGVFQDLEAEPLLRAAADQVRRFIVPTRTIADMLTGTGIDGSRLRLLPQGQYRKLKPADRDSARARLLGRAGKSLLVAALGYGDLRKGVDLFVDTVEAAAASGEKMIFAWQGDWDGEVRSRLDERVSRLMAEGYLLLLPTSPNIEELLHAADIFFLPSREDPLPSAAIEAWSIGLPVTAIEGAGGISDLIAEHPELGVLAAETSGKALLKALLGVDRAGRVDFRREWSAENFNWMSYVRQLQAEIFAPPALDVAIIGFNHGRYAQERIDSVLRQTMPARTITYHDVASPDASAAVAAASCTENGLRFIEEPSNGGRLHRSWAELASVSDAKYFHIAEGDDAIEPEMLERCVTALEEAPEAAYAFVGVSWVDERGERIAEHVGYPASVIGEEVAAGGEIVSKHLLASDLLVKNPILSISSVVWRREVLLDLLKDNASALRKLGFAFDWLLYLRAARAGHSAVFIAEPLCRHRQHDASFAERGNVERHRKEIRAIYELEPAKGLREKRSEYLDALG